VHRSVAASNIFAGFSAFSGSVNLMIERSVATHNGTGVVCNAGTTVRIGNMSISDNGAAVSSGGSCSRFGNNDSDASLAAFGFTAPQ
jgi:hypothetical protein